MSANMSPNLFRLTLPEWLKEQIDSGKHKGVYWIDEVSKIFHVPWKHASRNGWEDDDVSLFKAWAVYTNRFKEGVHEPKPALWKTNFRCAINSHNSITFLSDQGQRKGDSAHRIMKLIDPPKKGKRLYAGTDVESSENPRKLVRLTYPHSTYKVHSGVTPETCKKCSNLKQNIKIGLEAWEFDSSSLYYSALHEKYQKLLKSKTHICQEKNMVQLISFLSQTNPAEKGSSKSHQANLQDLLYIGKALQSVDDATDEKGKIGGVIDLPDESAYLCNVETVETEETIKNDNNPNENVLINVQDVAALVVKGLRQSGSKILNDDDVILPRNS